MSNLTGATERLSAAIAALDEALKAERAEAAKVAAALEAETAERAAALMRAEAAEKSLAEAEAKAKSSPAPDEIASLNERIGDLAEKVAEAERARDAAVATAEEMAAERDSAFTKLEEVNAARTDDARLREEAAEALDAAIGELRILSGATTHG